MSTVSVVNYNESEQYHSTESGKGKKKPPFLLSLCRFKGLQKVTARIIPIGLRTWEALPIGLPTLWYRSDSFE